MSQSSLEAIDPANLEQSVQPTSGEELSISYSGRAAPIAKIQLINLLMLIPTLGVYRFWAITRLRRYFWSSISINGTKLEYTGRGLELFLGLIIVLLVLVPIGLVVSMLLNYLILESPVLFFLLYLGVILGLTYLSYAAVYLRRRYILSRTKWRGIRMALHGSPWNFGLFGLKQLFLLIITMGIYTPYSTMNMQQRLWDNTYVGDKPMSCERQMEGVVARYWGIIGSYTLGYFLFASIAAAAFSLMPIVAASITTGVIFIIWWLLFFWSIAAYQARIIHNIMLGLKFQNLIFRSELNGNHLIKSYVIATAIIVGAGVVFFTVAGASSVYNIVANEFSLVYGFAFIDPTVFIPMAIAGALTYVVSLFVIPVVITHRLFRDVVATTAIGGTFDPETIAQSDEALLKRGEGLATALDVGGF